MYVRCGCVGDACLCWCAKMTAYSVKWEPNLAAKWFTMCFKCVGAIFRIRQTIFQSSKERMLLFLCVVVWGWVGVTFHGNILALLLTRIRPQGKYKDSHPIPCFSLSLPCHLQLTHHCLSPQTLSLVLPCSVFFPSPITLLLSLFSRYLHPFSFLLAKSLLCSHPFTSTLF